MKAKTFTLLTLLGLLTLALTSSAFSPVKKYGQLKVDGTHIVSENGEIVQLTGMSLFWSQWIDQYYNKECISWLKDDWKCSVVRAAIAVDQGGYATHPKDEFRKAVTVIDAAIDLGIYVIVDLHTHHAEDYTKEAVEFFEKIAEKYGKHPNIIYEIYNEPLKISWSKTIKPYSEKVIAAIRKYDKNNIIVCGTPYWSQRVDEAAMDPIEGSNIAYTLHFYAGTHGEELRKRGDEAMAKGLCLFVTEYGTTEANGDGNVYEKETREWYNWMDKHHISYCNWSIADKNESSAALVEGASGKGGWKMEEIKPSGQLVRKELISKHQQYFGQ